MTYLRLEGITKRFGSFVANDNISLSVATGTVHALLGENGAGKSTLMNILSGLYQPDAGQIYLEDKPVQINSSSKAIQLGIGMIHQHFMLVPQLSVTENIILGTGDRFNLNLRHKQQEITELSQAYSLEVDPKAKVGDLPVGVQQRVEILKALYRKARVLILDEPTAVLTPSEIESLIVILRQLAATGQTIIFISHKLEEVISLCDTVTILRRGQVVANTTTKDSSSQQLAELMVGREVVLQLHKSATSLGKKILSVQSLQVEDDRGVAAVRNISFQLHAGEILGVAGVDGNGQRELANAIAGLRSVKAGKILLDGRDVTLWDTQKRVRELQIGYIPEDRQTMGLIMGFSIANNLILKAFTKLPFVRRFFLQKQIIQKTAETKIQQFDIRASDSNVKISQLSGGNQQKVVLARELDREPSLIIAMQPTRGLDVGATAAVQQQLLSQRDRGAAILYISTELEEVLAISDRIAVIYRGEFIDVLDRERATIETIGLLMAGEKANPA
ncbi:MAG: Ribose import ATP-binding protein RbsA [Chroococcidiopsis sp. SAG 2025]|uniref:ABC transporter ATP-binding protein n=1 Tax=Chroococcidiopsis sp. SAG 2025 TaxID=171389 RepID=UPI0029370746|nr:ABC transporter ATP-binding protein [Chroococcidiopsis sp. SAG 2025]MDV2996132.1 Ribose import ATP-binding protein RbsA [Chroococcidiopsis sp. SAG 2025]